MGYAEGPVLYAPPHLHPYRIKIYLNEIGYGSPARVVLVKGLLIPVPLPLAHIPGEIRVNDPNKVQAIRSIHYDTFMVYHRTIINPPCKVL